MIKTEPGLASQSQRVVRVQFAVSAVVALLFIVQGPWAAISAFYGGMISVASAYMLRRGVARATELAKEDPAKSMTSLYVGAVLRFLGVIVLFALGMGLIKLVPLAVLIGFAAAQLSFLIASRAAKNN